MHIRLRCFSQATGDACGTTARQDCEGAKGAGLNIQKSKAVGVGSSDTSISGTNIPYYQDIAILGIGFAQTVIECNALFWSITT
jgi:hypothetical protein